LTSTPTHFQHQTKIGFPSLYDTKARNTKKTDSHIFYFGDHISDGKARLRMMLGIKDRTRTSERRRERENVEIKNKFLFK
jgi:hypothetical protein